MIGDWMGTIYGSNGKRLDIRLHLDHDGRYEWTERDEADYISHQAGRWSLDQGETVIRFQPNTADGLSHRPRMWLMLSITTCDDANTLLVLREVIFASRNLPILFYRVHVDRSDLLQPLSNRDRDLLLELIDNPPEPNDAIRKAAVEHRKRHGC